MKGDEMSQEQSHYLEIVGSCRKVMTESKITEPADDDQTPRSSRCSHAIVSREWTEVSDFGDIHNLYAAMDSAAGDRMERFDVSEDEICKTYTMIYRVGDKWFVTCFRAAVLIFSRLFEVKTVEILCGKWIKSGESEAIHRRIIEFLGV